MDRETYMEKIIDCVKPDKHSAYMACAQYGDWIPQAFSDHLDEAFIVQEIYLEIEIDGISEISHYYEAWNVKNGVCEKDSDQDSQDLFCIGHPMDDRDALKKSIGHRGSVTFTPKVFLVKEGSSLYYEIQFWPTNIVREANGLRSCYYTDELAKKVNGYQEFFREPFKHKWEFKDPDIIYEVVLDYCRKMFHRDSDIDRINFYMTIDDFFSKDVFPEIKQRVVDAWESQ